MLSRVRSGPHAGRACLEAKIFGPAGAFLGADFGEIAPAA